MKNEKTMLRVFTVVQWEREQKFLSEQHAKGWKIVRLSGFCYHFEKCEPEEVVYQLDYSTESDKSGYIQLFKDCGWEYLQDFCGYSYFRKAKSKMDGSEEGIFCDDFSRLEMLRKVFRSRMIPLIALFFCTVVPQFFNQMDRSNEGDGENFLFIFFSVLLVLYLMVFIVFAVHYYKFWKRVRK